MNTDDGAVFRTNDRALASVLTCKGLSAQTESEGGGGDTPPVYVFRRSPALQFVLKQWSSNQTIGVSPLAFTHGLQREGGEP